MAKKYIPKVPLWDKDRNLDFPPGVATDQINPKSIGWLLDQELIEEAPPEPAPEVAPTKKKAADKAAEVTE